ncbi:MAG: hypothetical protein AAEJ04_07525 [Planctomycetota bacterium]
MNELKGSSDAGHTRVVAPDYATAVRILQDRFGSDWTVVHSRNVRRPGFFGWFGISDVVVIVRNEKSESVVGSDKFEVPTRDSFDSVISSPNPSDQITTGYSSGPIDHATCDDLVEHLQGARTQIASELQQFSKTSVVDREPEAWEVDHFVSSKNSADIVDEFKEESVNVFSEDSFDAVGGDFDDSANEVIDPRFLGAIRRLLDSSGIPAHAHSKIIGAVCSAPIAADLSLEQLQDLAHSRVGACLLGRIPVTAPIETGVSGSPRVVALVGPTGVGKTTTLAKLASYFHLVEKKRVGLITLDSYRVGAIEQLRRFAEILGLPLKTVMNLEATKEAIAGFSDCDLILIDTAGRSQRDAERLGEVRDSLASIEDIEVHLCLSLGAAPEAVLAAAESFQLVGYDRVIFTKKDESYRKGFLWDLFGLAPVPISYVTCGQEVPEDMVEATREGIKEMILEG